MQSLDSFVVRDVSRRTVEQRLLAMRAEPDADWKSYGLASVGTGSESSPITASVRLVQQGGDVKVEATYHHAGWLKSQRAWFQFCVVDARRLLRRGLGAAAEEDVHGAPGVEPAPRSSFGSDHSVNELTRQTPPTALPGPSSVRLLALASGLVACGALAGALNGVVAGLTRSPLVAGIGFVVVLLILALSIYPFSRSSSKRTMERAHGYTVDIRVGQLHPELWILDFRTLEPRFAPELLPIVSSRSGAAALSARAWPPRTE